MISDSAQSYPCLEGSESNHNYSRLSNWYLNTGSDGADTVGKSKLLQRHIVEGKKNASKNLYI